MQHLSAHKLLCNKPMKPIDLDEDTINKEVPDSLSAKRNSSTRFNCLPCWSFVTILSSRHGRRDVLGDFSSDRGNPPLFNQSSFVPVRVRTLL
jgi:hypothetical protein